MQRERERCLIVLICETLPSIPVISIIKRDNKFD